MCQIFSRLTKRKILNTYFENGHESWVMNWKNVHEFRAKNLSSQSVCGLIWAASWSNWFATRQNDSCTCSTLSGKNYCVRTVINIHTTLVVGIKHFSHLFCMETFKAQPKRFRFIEDENFYCEIIFRTPARRFV